MKILKPDVLIIGTGIAGLTAAIKLSEKKLNILLVTREKKPETTNTFWAQGGIIFSPDNQADIDSLMFDIQKASSNTSSLEATKILAAKSGKIVEEILMRRAETTFALDESGELLFTKEAAHSKERIIYNGDMTGKSIQIALLNLLNDKIKFPNITILTSHTAIDLITPYHHGVELIQRYENDKVLGAYVLDQESQEVIKVVSPYTILATGGVGALYLHHSNAEGARGDGHAMAYRAGAFMSNMEFIQFHPTTFYNPNSHRRFLISEALRGEGGVLINRQGEAFMSKYHSDLDLAPRDIVSRSIISEMIISKSDFVYLDMTKKEREYLKTRFPTIFEHCLSNKIDISRDPIPVVPAAHYTCGGVKTNLKGKTNLEGLYAVGEVACTGLHGANRLASTSLLEGLTWGYIASEDILSEFNRSKEPYPEHKIKDWTSASGKIDSSLVHQDIMTLKQTMWNYVGIVRSKNRLNRAKAMFTELQDEVSRFYKNARLADDLIGLRNGIEVAFMIVNASLRNKNSEGCFYLSDTSL
jgi:L-aspartate oxidase